MNTNSIKHFFTYVVLSNKDEQLFIEYLKKSIPYIGLQDKIVKKVLVICMYKFLIRNFVTISRYPKFNCSDKFFRVLRQKAAEYLLDFDDIKDRRVLKSLIVLCESHLKIKK